ncbi:MAG: tRNA lysidine(34) synthetase TilS [Anaerolineales bacterium]|nr:tRNA lysidine(34) synthetase TilS [Anaerolineales bacterium]
MWLPQVLQSLTDHGVGPADRLLLGFSGGLDSLALLHALRAADRPVLAAHLDHGLRTNSTQHARQAGELARSLGAGFIARREDVGAYAAEHKLSIEEAARKRRYAFLFEAAASEDATAVLSAHQADDQAETVLMHLLRGAGPAGLRGMQPRWLPNPWSDTIPLLRPLLGVPRAELEVYCLAHDLAPIEDESNADTRFFRNRVRHELLPPLEAAAPGAARRLTQTADLLAAEQALLEALGDAAWQRSLKARGTQYLCLSRAALRGEPLALQRSLLRRAWSELGAPGELSFETVQASLALATGPSPVGRLDWPGALQLWLEGDALWLAAPGIELPLEWPQAEVQPQPLPVPAALDLPGGWRLQASFTAVAPAGWVAADGLQAWLDADALPGPLSVRRPQPGDRFQPLGLEGSHQKLSDFFINAKLPQRARAGWPLVCSGETIVWVAGYRPAHPVRLQAASQRVLHLQLTHSMP